MKVRLSTMAAVVFLVAAGAWGAMQAMAATTDDLSAVQPAGAEHLAQDAIQVQRTVRKVRGPQDKLDFVNYRRTWRTYYA